MRRSTAAKALCSAAGAQAVTAYPVRRARSAMATATGLEPHTTICGRGRTGSTNTSMVPWLGHMFLAKRTPARSSPARRPCSSRISRRSTATRRDRPSAIASRAALSTAARAQPPPIQPSDTVPSERITALAPALTAVAATVRTTVASAKGSPLAFICETESMTSPASFMASDPRQIGLERGEAREIMRRREQIDIGERRLHAARLRGVVPPADQRVEPDDAAAAAAQLPHLVGEALRRTGIITVGDDHHRGARGDHALGVPAVECRQALADARAAADPLRHPGQPVDRARDIAVAQRRRDMGEAGGADEGPGAPEGTDDALQEADEKSAGQLPPSPSRPPP